MVDFAFWPDFLSLEHRCIQFASWFLPYLIGKCNSHGQIPESDGSLISIPWKKIEAQNLFISCKRSIFMYEIDWRKLKITLNHTYCLHDLHQCDYYVLWHDDVMQELSGAWLLTNLPERIKNDATTESIILMLVFIITE